MKTLIIAGSISGMINLMAGAAFGNPVTSPEGLVFHSPADAPLAVERVSDSRQSFTAYITGYSYWDNTPPGSAAIARPVIHRRAGGKGTYNDPVTIAVGYRLVGGKARLDYPAGTRFYLPHLQRYAIVEDICGNGPNPHLTGCARGNGGRPWLDIYVDGSRAGAAAANNCMNRRTGFHESIVNPQKGDPVSSGQIPENRCGTASR